MREILFRGKNVDDGEWAYGCFAMINDSPYIIAEDAFFDYGGIFGCDEVIPESVGQYTGLVDRNGTKIFEGDIVTEGCNGLTSVVVWDMSKGTYRLKDLGDGYTIEYAHEWEVIGNIHDNPVVTQ